MPSALKNLFRVSVRSWFIVFVCLALFALEGCAKPAPSLTASAFAVRSGEGMLEFVADEPGDVYLLGPNSNKPLIKIALRRGERITVEPGRDRIEAAGVVRRHKTPLRSNRRYRLYFDRSG